MSQVFSMQKVAVLGAGVMGAQIAAHCVNANIKTYLFDLPSASGDKSAIAQKAIANLTKLRPSPLAYPELAASIEACNYEEHLDRLAEVDLVIEAIAERLDWKLALYARIAPVLSAKTVLATNTSGLSLQSLSQALPQALAPRFCGLHFFNPPRYMHLLEMIPGPKTDPALLDALETCLSSVLGKGVIRAHDTPNFIANRLGVFSLLSTIRQAERFAIPIDQVDALTGPLLGRPRSATFRTMDVVGLDTMAHVLRTMQEQLGADPWHAQFQLPAWILALIAEGHLGQKTGQGCYRKTKTGIEVYEPSSQSYRPSAAVLNPEIVRLLQIADPEQKMQALLSSELKEAQFIRACILDLLQYAAYHAETIAPSLREMDLALRWGFGWEQGPFELWQLSGFRLLSEAILTQASMQSLGLPAWMDAITAFYTEAGAYSPTKRSYIEANTLPVYQKQYYPDGVLKQKAAKAKRCFDHPALSLSHFEDELAIVSFKTKANSISTALLDGLSQALDIVQREFAGLVIYQDSAANFSAGADLKEILQRIEQRDWAGIESMLKGFQQLVQRIKYSPQPIVAALRGKALGGGCELLLHCQAAVAAFESYPGLVEMGVGLIPAGGGCKEMAVRAAQSAPGVELAPRIEQAFRQIAYAEVAASAPAAKRMGYLRPADTVLMHSQEVLAVALAKVRYLLAANYQAPLPSLFPVVGREGFARMESLLINQLDGGFIGQPEYATATRLARVLSGGDLYQGSLVDENWILGLELQAFMELVQTEACQMKMKRMLKMG